MSKIRYKTIIKGISPDADPVGTVFEGDTYAEVFAKLRGGTHMTEEALCTDARIWLFYMRDSVYEAAQGVTYQRLFDAGKLPDKYHPDNLGALPHMDGHAMAFGVIGEDGRPLRVSSPWPHPVPLHVIRELYACDDDIPTGENVIVHSTNGAQNVLEALTIMGVIAPVTG